MNSYCSATVVAHHFRIFGLRASTEPTTAPECVWVTHGCFSLSDVWSFASGGGTVVIAADSEAAGSLGVRIKGQLEPREVLQSAIAEDQGKFRRMWTLHPAHRIEGAGEPVITDVEGIAVWRWIRVGKGGVMVCGTELGADLIRFRQGDPAKIFTGLSREKWGYSGERPDYLYEDQFDPDRPAERVADIWCHVIVRAIESRVPTNAWPILPLAAPGAVVVTGDDDQAKLENYRRQSQLLGDVPITYFLHPKTNHTKESMRAMQRDRNVDFGLHPDALEDPDKYGSLFCEQYEWYRKLTGERPFSVRNHGFLNSGYWEHLGYWLRGAVQASANIPGFDGRVLNGSLFPARMVKNDNLTDHWSILTAIGDGIMFAGNMDGSSAHRCIHHLANSILQSGIPGVMVLNLHPDNVSHTEAMHGAVREVIDAGFIAWTMRECIKWFSARDHDLEMARLAPKDYVNSSFQG